MRRTNATFRGEIPQMCIRDSNYSLLYSIVRNLMDNAIAYAGTNIHINISCFREDENYYLSLIHISNRES